MSHVTDNISSDTAMILIVLYIHHRAPNTDVAKNGNFILIRTETIIALAKDI